jgi:DNA-binding MarR family transcriptional regulator
MKPRSLANPTLAAAEALRRIRLLVGTLQASARSVERRTGITNAQLFLLRALQECDHPSLGELAATARTQQSTVSIVVQRLVKTGLVRRRRSPEDGRRVLLSLTAMGRATLRHAPVPPTARLLEALGALSRAELGCLIRGLSALELRLGVVREEPGMLFEAPRRAGATRVRKRTPARPPDPREVR